ncbi:EI24 domain-containing protein [Nocardiopsis sp. HNM0947]|uniref:EI24 domain-containing protein n=1 Tax=Nocardiopsis coralli TaxID=2772213 RepID=A0ABR9P8D7_9ACTN|nr:EI24 domain-containing protein [Nocardiopsis coralli]
MREIFGGFGYLLRGVGLLLRRPRLFLLGTLPAVFVWLVFLGLFIALVVNIEELVGWATPFAADWDQTWQALVRGAVSLATLLGALLLFVVSFTTVTLAVGSPVYDKIAELVENELGGAPEEADDPLLASVTRSVRQTAGIVLVSLAVTVTVFVLGLVPFVGWMAGPVIAAVAGGWLLGIELVANAFDRRGLFRVRDRRRYMATRRLRVLGFAIPTYFLLAVPFLAVVVFPAATAGATVLARDLLPAAPPEADEA